MSHSSKDVEPVSQVKVKGQLVIVKQEIRLSILLVVAKSRPDEVKDAIGVYEFNIAPSSFHP